MTTGGEKTEGILSGPGMVDAETGAPKSVRIRIAQPDDVNELASLAHQMIVESPLLSPFGFDRDVFDEFYRNRQSGTVLIADVGGAAVGAIILTLAPVHLACTTLAVSDLAFYVLPEWRRQGIADQLVERMEQIGVQIGAEVASIGSSAGNPKPIDRIAQQRGYRQTTWGFAKRLPAREGE